MAKIELTSKKLDDGRYMRLTCEQVSNGSIENSSTIKWTLKVAGGEDDIYYSTGPTKVVINGTTVYSKDRVSWNTLKFPAGKGSASGEIVVPHKTDGTKTITVKFSTAIYTSTINEYSESWELDSIPRYGSIAIDFNSKTETSIKMNWSSDSTVDYLWYSKDNGSSWTGVNVTDGKSGTFTISGLSPLTIYPIKARIRRKDSQLTTDSGVFSVQTYDYPYCTSSPNFVIGDAVTLGFYNPLKRTFKFYIIGNGAEIDVEYNCSSSIYENINDHTTIISKLYATLPNKTSSRYQVKVVYENSVKTNDGGTYRINESECAPTFSTFTYKDTNATTVAVTGNDQVLVKGLSTLSVTIPAANKMVAKNSATPGAYSVSIDTLSATIPYSIHDATKSIGIVTSAGSKRLSVRAVDSRILSTEAHKDITVYDYAKPTITASAVRLNNFENQTTIKVNGTYSRLTIGGADKNAVQSVEYRYRESGGTWGEWKPLTAAISDGKYVCDDLVINLDNALAFDLEFKAKDKLGETIASASVDVGQAIFFISSNKKTCYLNGDEVATLNSAHPIGSVYCHSTNVNPSDLFGGTWTLIDKEFASKNALDSTIFVPNTNVTVKEARYTAVNHMIRIRLTLQIDIAMTDTGTKLGNFVWSKIGISQMPMGITGLMSYSDGANGGIVCNLVYDSGELAQVDVIETTPTATGQTFNFEAVFGVVPDIMNDSACDKFYYKRTS